MAGEDQGAEDLVLFGGCCERVAGDLAAQLTAKGMLPGQLLPLVSTTYK